MTDHGGEHTHPQLDQGDLAESRQVANADRAEGTRVANADRQESRDSVQALNDRVDVAVAAAAVAEAAAVVAGDKAAIAGRTSRSEVSGLAVEVGRLGYSVSELTDLIQHSLVQAEMASAAVQTRPSRKLFWLVATALAALAVGLAGIGAYVVHHNRQAQYRACFERNASQQSNDAYLKRIDGAVMRAAKKGSILGRELSGILIPQGAKPVVLPNCSLLR